MRFLFLLLLVTGCAKKLDGEWSGNDWGQVLFVGTRGSYASTYSGSPGEIDLTQAGAAFKGTWGEGPKRHGRLELKLDASGNLLTGDWTADEDSTVRADNGGIIRWTRKLP